MRFYTYYIALLTVLIFIITYPLQLIFIQFKALHFIGHKINKFIIQTVVFLGLFKVEIIDLNSLEKRNKYIFCSNHSSYFDIPSFYLITKKYFKFIGKSSLEKIPLFGYMYKHLYITLNRRSAESRQKAFDDSKDALNNNIGIAIYPEGAIPHQAPQLIPFKDGAFKLSIETNTPIIPITLPYNHLVLPVGDHIRSRHIKIIIHKPLNTEENPYTDYKQLKEDTFQIIQNELSKHGVI